MDTAGIQGAVAKLNELKALGIITEPEYQQRKGELIDKALSSATTPAASNSTFPQGKGQGKGFASGKGKGAGKGAGKGKGYQTGFNGYGQYGQEGWQQGGKGRGNGWQNNWAQNNWQQAGWQGGKGGGKYNTYPNADANSASRVLLVTFKDSTFPGHDVVAGHFAGLATVEKITHVTKEDREQALVQVTTAEEAGNCVRNLNHSSADWCQDIDVQKARVQELTFKINDDKNKSYIHLQPGRVLLLTLVGLQGPFPGLDSLYEMFKIYGVVERMSHVTKPDREQCMVQFSDAASAASAMSGLQDWNMGFCTFNLQVARTDALTFKQSDDRNKDFTGQV